MCVVFFPFVFKMGFLILFVQSLLTAGLHSAQWVGLAFLLDGPYKDGAVNHLRAS